MLRSVGKAPETSYVRYARQTLLSQNSARGPCPLILQVSLLTPLIFPVYPFFTSFSKFLHRSKIFVNDECLTVLIGETVGPKSENSVIKTDCFPKDICAVLSYLPLCPFF